MRAFVAGMQRACIPGARVLIADIGNEQRTLRDLIKTLKFAMREQMLPDVAAMTVRMWFADASYRSLKQSGRSYLHLPAGYFKQLARELGVSITELDMQFTINANYKNILVEI